MYSCLAVEQESALQAAGHVESCSNEIRGFMIANKLKLASLAFSRADTEIERFMTADKLKHASQAFSRADKEIYDCRQAEICLTGFFKDR